MTRKFPIQAAAAALLIGFAMIAAPSAQAQTITSYAVGYVDGDETGLGLLGVQVRPGGFGWQPIGSLEGFVLGYPSGVGDEQTSLWSISPGAGVMYAGQNGAVSARGSYQLIGGTEDEEATNPFFSGGESGPAVTLQGLYWGSRPAVEGLVNYNLTSSYVYSQLQAHLPIVRVDPGSIDVGAEYVYQADLDDEDTRVQLIGPLVRWATGTGAFVILGGGWKNNLGPADDTWYGRATAVLEF